MAAGVCGLVAAPTELMLQTGKNSGSVFLCGCRKTKRTSLIILMAIQLLPLSTRSSKNLGDRGRKSCGRRHPSSQMTLMAAVVTLLSSWSSMRRSLILGHPTLSASGYTKASRYRHTTVFLRTTALECERRDRMSGSKDIASEGVMMCGRVTRGRDMLGILEDTMSYELVR